VDVADLTRIPLFSQLSKRQLELVSRHADEVTVKAGSVIMREGDLAREVCIVVEGTVRVASSDRVVADLGAGEVFGEMGVVTGQHRMATVTAVTDTRLLVMFGPEFTGVADEIAEMRQGIAAIIAKRRGG
jgi:CRP-like cAMP-binding protein